MGECSSFMAGPPGSDPEAEAVPFLGGAHDGSDTSHLGEACLDQAVSGLQACVPLGNLVVVGLRLFLSWRYARQKSSRRAMALRISGSSGGSLVGPEGVGVSSMARPFPVVHR